MVVESAERFGLAQLHQLRGRIGRGAGPSACLLMHGSGASDESSEPEQPAAALPAAPDSPASARPADEPAAGLAAGLAAHLNDGPADSAAAAAGPVRRKRVPRAAAPEAEAAPPLPLGSGTTARARLEILARMSNGFHIAEADLRIRGPGEVLGTRQAGLPPLRYADLLRDLDLLQIARREAAAALA